MKTALLIMSYGTPGQLDEVEAYYTHIRRGNPPPPDLLEELIDRYRAVGGPTALNEITREQARAIGVEVARRHDHSGVFVGFKHVDPFIGDAVSRMATAGIERGVGLVLAPHYSLRSIAEYERYATEAAPVGLSVEVVRSWHDHPGFIECLSSRLMAALETEEGDPHVVFTAHSVPAAVLDRGDPYPNQLMRTCELVAARTGLDRWSFAYQSAGRTRDPWLGPDILDRIDELADSGERGVVVQAIGFVADHLEVLYDLDIEARNAAEGRGLRFTRAAMPNADPDFISALADVVCSRIEAHPVTAGADPTS